MIPQPDEYRNIYEDRRKLFILGTGLTKKQLLFYFWTNNTLALEMVGVFNSGMYQEVFAHILLKIELKSSSRGEVKIVTGFGAAECEDFSSRSENVKFVYDVNTVHDECFQEIKKDIERDHGPVQYVSMRGKAYDSWTQFLLRPFVRTLKLPEGLSKKSVSILEEFKQNVAAGIHHLTVAGVDQSKLIINLPEVITEQLVRRVRAYPTHAGIVTLHVSHGSDLISYTRSRSMTPRQRCVAFAITVTAAAFQSHRSTAWGE